MMKKIVLISTLMIANFAYGEEIVEATSVPTIPGIPGSEVYLFDIDNKAEVPELLNGKNITRSVGYDSQPRFGKKGKFVYYTKIQNGQADIFQYNIKTDTNSAFMETPESEYSPTTIPGEKGLSVIQVDDKGDQYLVKLKKTKKDDSHSEKFSDLKQVGYHNWTQNKGHDKGLQLWTFILNDKNGGDLYHQGEDKVATKLLENVGRSFITDKNHSTLYYVDKAPKPWQIASRSHKDGPSKKVMDLPVGTEDFTLDSKGRFWAGQGKNLFVSTDQAHWTLAKQFINLALGNISRLTTNPNGNQIAIVFQEVSEQKNPNQ